MPEKCEKSIRAFGCVAVAPVIYFLRLADETNGTEFTQNPGHMEHISDLKMKRFVVDSAGFVPAGPVPVILQQLSTVFIAMQGHYVAVEVFPAIIADYRPGRVDAAGHLYNVSQP